MFSQLPSFFFFFVTRFSPRLGFPGVNGGAPRIGDAPRTGEAPQQAKNIDDGVDVPKNNEKPAWIFLTTLPETNIAPENGWLEYYFPIGKAYFQGLC